MGICICYDKPKPIQTFTKVYISNKSLLTIIYSQNTNNPNKTLIIRQGGKKKYLYKVYILKN